MNRYESTKKVSFLGIVGNIFLLVIKFIVAVFSHSEAMMADAINSAGDIFSSIMSYIGNKIAGVPSDEDHNFGHGKAEYIFSLFIGMSMIAIAFKLLYDAIFSLINGNYFDFSWWLVGVCIITIVIKLGLFIYANSISKKFDNLLLKSNLEDHRNDCIITSFTLISIFLSLLDIYWFDSVVSIGISIWIFYTGIKIFIESFNVLMDKSLDEKNSKKILELTSKYPEIQKVRHLNTTPVGYRYLVSLTIFVDGNLSTFESHRIADSLEKDLKKLDFVYLPIIHVNPV